MFSAHAGMIQYNMVSYKSLETLAPVVRLVLRRARRLRSPPELGPSLPISQAAALSASAADVAAFVRRGWRRADDLTAKFTRGAPHGGESPGLVRGPP